MPFSVKHVTHAFLQHEKKFLSTINESIEPYPSPLKELVNRKYRYKWSYKKIAQSRRNENKVSHNPSEFYQPKIRKYRNGEEFWDVCYYKIQGTQTTFLTHFASTLFTTVDLAKWWKVHTGTHGLFSQKPAPEHCRAHSGIQEGLGLHSCLFPRCTRWSLGQVAIYFRAVPKGGHWARRTQGEVPVISGIGAFV